MHEGEIAAIYFMISLSLILNNVFAHCLRTPVKWIWYFENIENKNGL